MGDFRELDVWKESHGLTLKIYSLTNNLPQSEKFGLISQIRRAAVSVESNIAEGDARYSTLENIRFFDISRASIAEVITQLLIISDIYSKLSLDCSKLVEEFEVLGKRLTSLIKYRSKTEKPNKPI